MALIQQSCVCSNQSLDDLHNALPPQDRKSDKADVKADEGKDGGTTVSSVADEVS